MQILRPLSVLAFFSSPLLAGTLTVGPVGSSATFNDIGIAVNAAAPGDTILVAPGDYQSTTPIVIDKPLTLLGAGPETTRFTALGMDTFDTALPMLIEGLAAGETVRVHGLELNSGGFLSTPSRAVRLFQNAGRVQLSDLSVPGENFMGGEPGLVEALACAEVVIDGCHFDAGQSLVSRTAGLYALNSTVWINDTQLWGTDSANGLFTSPPVGGDGLLADQSTVYISRSSFQGGDGIGNVSVLFAEVAQPGGHGVAASASHIEVRGSTLVGGEGSLDLDNGTQLVGAGGLAVAFDAASTVRLAPDADLVSGLSGLGLPNVPAVAGTGTLAPFAVRLASLDAQSANVSLGGTLGLDLFGEPFAFSRTFVHVAGDTAVPLPGWEGVLLLAPFGGVGVHTGTLDAQGERSVTLGVPALPALANQLVMLQAFQGGPSGTLSASALAVIGLN